ncbi:MAG TPA: hypothetical protein VJO32_14940 [Ktedonobacteraceae bacterium]|nr:hypothetical protein [Ktedonobacteraceae bacterium]
MSRLLYKRRLDRYDVCAGAIIVLGTLLRLVFILLGWPASYNDEGTLGLMALHIAYKGAHPLLYYGQDYLGSLEAYLGAGFFHLFGASTPVLRLGLLLLFALFLVSMYFLAALLYAKSLALVTLIFLSLGSPEVLLRQLMAAGGTPELMFFTALLLLLTAWLALTANPARHEYKGTSNDSALSTIQQPAHLSWRRIAAYGAWGVIAGFDLYSHLLCLPFVLSAGLMLMIFCRRELRLLSISILLLCLLIGISPLIIYNVTTPVNAHELSLFTGSFGGGYREPSYPTPPGMPPAQAFVAPKPIAPRPAQQIAGTLLVGIPVATNGTALCPVSSTDAWPLTDQTSGYIRFCTGVHGAWGIGFVLLWFIATISAFRHFIQYRRSQRKTAFSLEFHRASIIQASRLMILLGAGLTILAFTLYPQAAAVTPWISARYLVGLLIAIPAILFPLWEKKGYVIKTLRAGSAYLKTNLRTYMRYALILLAVVVALLGTIEIFTTQLPLAQASSTSQQALINRLVQMGATHIYTDYDDCNRIAFLSNERIVCAVLDDGLQPGLDRYFPYRVQVANAPHPFYMFPTGSVQAYLLEQKAAQQHISYAKFIMGSYVVYDPAQRIAT